MRSLAVGLATLCTLVPVAAVAQPSADDLRGSGEQAAREGRYSEAIAAFKASNKLQPRATNYCLIGLAYTRRELWPQAEVMIDRCKTLATASDPLPDWLPALETALAERLASVDVAPIELVVEPAASHAELTVSSFAPDEQFAPRTIHLPPGRHVVIASAQGYDDAQQTIEVTDKHPQRVVITLHVHGAAVPVPAPVPQPPPQRAAPSKVPMVVIGAGAAVIAAGAIYHLAVLRPAANRLADATDSTPDPALYDRWSHRYDVRRATTVGLYAAGALTIGIGVVLKLTVFEHAEAPVQVSATSTDGGGIVSVGWTR